MAGKYNPEKHHRRSIRLKGYDYAQAGAYFVTICTQGRECLFGEYNDGAIVLADFGKIVSNTWQWLATQYGYVELDEYVVMPNHIHGILVINNLSDDLCRGNSCRGASRSTPTVRKPLGRLVGAFKTVSAKHINKLRNTPGIPVWQRNYFERVIRNETEINCIRQYIINNPLQWDNDENNPANSL